MTKRFNVYGIGNAIMDLQLSVAEEDLQRFQLEKGAMKLVEVETQAELIRYFHGRDINQASGGSAANTMIAIEQLGGKTAYGCLIGSDQFGEQYASEMAELGVELHSEPVDGVQTGTCVVLITPDAERTMNTNLGASQGFDAPHVSEAHIKAAEWLYVEGYLFSSEGGQRAVERAINIAKNAGVKVAITFSDGFIVDFFRSPLEAAVKQADLLFANLNEAKRFTGQETEEDAFNALLKAAPNAVMTMSDRGALVGLDGEVSQIEAFPTKAVDDTGAGDMFAGGFLYGITHGLSGREAGKLACFLASKVVSQLGARLQCDVKELIRGGDFLPSTT